VMVTILDVAAVEAVALVVAADITSKIDSQQRLSHFLTRLIPHLTYASHLF